MPSLHPLTHVYGRIQDKSVKRAFERVTEDRGTPLEISEREVDKLFDAAAHDNYWVKGDATLPRELEDFEMIKSEAPWLLRTDEAKAKFEQRIGALRKLPKADWQDNDGSLRSRMVAINKISIRGTASGFVYCPPNAMCIGAPSTVGLTVGDQTFRVHPKTGEASDEIAERLAAKLGLAGIEAKVSTYRGAAFVELKGARDPHPVEIEAHSHDRGINLRVDGDTIRFNTGPMGVNAHGGSLHVTVNGIEINVRTAAGENGSNVVKRLEKAIEDATGYDVRATPRQGIDTMHVDLQVVTPGNVERFASNAYADLKGTIVMHDENNPGPDFGSERYGAWLALDKPVKVDNTEVREIYIGWADQGHQAGDEVHLNGRLDINEGAQEIHPNEFVSMSGVSNLSKGEPRYNGRTFFGKGDKALKVLSYIRPFIADVPTDIFVLDQGADTAFFGARGGFIPPEMNPFHGFSGSAPIENAADSDRAEVRFDPATSQASDATTGEPLTHIGGTPIVATVTNPRRWFYNGDTGTAYRFSGTVMDQVIRREPEVVHF